MSDSSPYAAGVYVKGDDERVANTPARAVALAFEGYKLKDEDTSSSSAPEAAPVTETAPVKDDTPSDTPTPKALARPRRESQETQTQ